MFNLLDPMFISNDAFREVFRSMNEGIIIVNKDGLIIRANAVAEKMLGYETEKLNGLPVEDLIPTRFKSIHVVHRKAFNKNPTPRKMGYGRDLLAQ